MSTDALPRLAAALASRKQMERGAGMVHAAVVVDVPVPGGAPGETFPYPGRQAICGAPTWGAADGVDADPPRLHLVNCGGCRRTRLWKWVTTPRPAAG